ncbi:MAG: bifunctional 4-hydroxy-2-oxoglutarate aldolase/2-dehydro-3-deoxy-phosphogluconate aldolase [Clostridia bacterium]|nr:bifunctional 4-hydroxy-2-oxoglutarate aldolase/2-dehydro-3-deoxy-phosphogluconate aldolase [Clostridia bacterium]
MKNLLESLEQTGILPVINIPSVSVATTVANAVRNGGINTIEVTLRSADSLESIKAIKAEYPDMVVAAGTVLSTETVDKALSAGADYIVCPGYDEEIVDYCISKDILVVPGISSGSEIQNAVKKGLKILKFFPAELNGGIEAIKLLSGPFPSVRFVPTGGINFGNLGSYLQNDKILACGGSYMATADQIKNGDFEGITAACKKALDISLGFELAHVGINNENGETALAGAEKMSETFRLPTKVGNSSIFSGTAVEFMKTMFYGTKGHIGFKTNSMARALEYFKANGIEVIEESIRRDDGGKLVSAYLKDEIGGFAVHIVKR